MWLQSPSEEILEPKKTKSVPVSIFSPSICHEVMEPAAMILIFLCWVINQLFHCLLSHSSGGSLVPLHFLPLKLYHLHYLKLLIFLLTILIPACDSSSLAFHMMYSVYKLNKKGYNIQPWCNPFPVLNQNVFPCLVLTDVSWPAYKFLRK